MYKVIALSCSGKGKRIFSSGDIVNETDFPEGTIEGLILGGFLKEIPDEKNESKIPKNTEEIEEKIQKPKQGKK